MLPFATDPSGNLILHDSDMNQPKFVLFVILPYGKV